MENEKDTIAVEMHTRALDKTRAFFKALDLRALDEMRVGLELAPEQLSVVIDVYLRALEGERVVQSRYRVPTLAAAPPEVLIVSRLPVPMSSVGFNARGERFTVTQTLKKPYKPDRMFIAPPSGESAAEWIVHDVLVDGKTQFAQAGELPGDMFLSSAIDSFVSFDTGTKFEIVASYVGEKPAAPFFGGFLGRQDDSAKDHAAEV